MAETRELALTYERNGCSGFATKLGNAAESFYTFVLHPGMDPTNNLAECTLRPGVIARKIRFELRTAGGQKMFGSMTSCIVTWHLLRYNGGCRLTHQNS